MLVDLGKLEAILPPTEQVPGERYVHGERLKCYVLHVRKGYRGPSVTLSRTHPNLVKKLFALEVPEIADGAVEIAAIAREAGHRTKIAVISRQPGVNAKGACIGPMGSRVRNVMAELHGEKIDIVDYSEDPAEFVANALSPARVSRVDVVDAEARVARVIVPDYQLSLAIGKEGQNARLAARLTGWRIDIRPDTAARTATDGRPAARRRRSAPAAGRSPRRRRGNGRIKSAMARRPPLRRALTPVIRTCVGCGSRAAKSDLLRLVASGDEIVPDPRAVMPGRGAYLHPSQGCLERAQRRRALIRALRLPGPLGTGGIAGYLEALTSGGPPARPGTVQEREQCQRKAG